MVFCAGTGPWKSELMALFLGLSHVGSHSKGGIISLGLTGGIFFERTPIFGDR